MAVRPGSTADAGSSFGRRGTRRLLPALPFPLSPPLGPAAQSWTRESGGGRQTEKSGRKLLAFSAAPRGAPRPHPTPVFFSGSHIRVWNCSVPAAFTETRVGSSLGRVGRVVSVRFKELLRSDHFGGQRPWKGEDVRMRRLGTPRETAGFRGGQVREKAGDSSSQPLPTAAHLWEPPWRHFSSSSRSPPPAPPPLFLSPSPPPLSSTFLSPSLPLTLSIRLP